LVALRSILYISNLCVPSQRNRRVVAAESKFQREPIIIIRKIARPIFALIATFLSKFWFLQDVGILNVCPILCFADRACIEGGSALLTVVGAIDFIVGIITIITTTMNQKK
jgi:hypothetical protein